MNESFYSVTSNLSNKSTTLTTLSDLFDDTDDIDKDIMNIGSKLNVVLSRLKLLTKKRLLMMNQIPELKKMLQTERTYLSTIKHYQKSQIELNKKLSEMTSITVSNLIGDKVDVPISSQNIGQSVGQFLKTIITIFGENGIHINDNAFIINGKRYLADNELTEEDIIMAKRFQPIHIVQRSNTSEIRK